MRSCDFIAYAGETAAIVLSTPVGGRRKFTGIVEDYVDGEVELSAPTVVIACRWTTYRRHELNTKLRWARSADRWAWRK